MSPSSPTSPWAFLNVLTKRRYDLLKRSYGPIADWPPVTTDILVKIGVREEFRSGILTLWHELETRNLHDELQAQNMRLLSVEDELFPSALRTIPDHPVFLFLRGNPDTLLSPCIAFVGTRRMSAYGERVVEHFVEGLVQAGLGIVSGLAMGIDAHVARETMRQGGRTIAVLGYGLGTIYPHSLTPLAEAVVKANGLLLTEYPPLTPPERHTFPARNRIIAGLTLGTIVAEAPARSGALITASLALEYGREVFAVPGSIFDPLHEGTHRLIARSGAKLAVEPGDILTELRLGVPAPSPAFLYKPQTPEEETLFLSLESLPQSADALVEKTQFFPHTINALLTLLELKGAAKNIGAGQWIRTCLSSDTTKVNAPSS